MSRLPVVSGRELCKILKKIGYSIDHQTGSHIILRNEDSPHRRLTDKEIAKGTLRSILRQSGLSSEESKDLIIKK